MALGVNASSVLDCETAPADPDDGLWDTWARRDIAHPFMLRAWLATSLRTHPQLPKARTVSLKRDGRTICILPLALTGRLPGTRRLFFAGEGASDYQTILGEERGDDTLRALLECLLKDDAWDYIELYPLRQRDLDAVRRAWSRAGCLVDVETRGICPSMELSASWQTLIEARVLKDVLYQKRRLDKDGGLEIRAAAHYPDIRYFLSILFKFHIKRWREAGKRSKYENRLNQQRCYRLARIWFDAGLLDFQVLFQNGRPMALHLGAKTPQRYYYYIPTFDPDFKKHSPGKILLWHLIDQSAREGIPYFDFLRGAEAYKREWGALCEEPYGCLRLFRDTAAGRACRLAHPVRARA